MPSSPLLDQVARDRLSGLAGVAATPADLDTSFAVEAGAGSGKTTALVGRVVALAEAGVDLRSVVAITFTRRAAAELRARAYDGLSKRARVLVDPGTAPGALPDAATRLARVQAALGALDAACFDTIHGFCGRLLRADALAAGLPPDFGVAEDREADEARRDLWRRHVREQARSTAAHALASAGLTPRDVEPLFTTLVDHPDRLPEPTGAPPPDLEPAVALAQAATASWRALRPDPPLGSRDGLQQALDTAERLEILADLGRAPDQARFLQTVYGGCGADKGKAPVTLNRWHARGDADAKAVATALRDDDGPALAARLRPTVLAWQAHQHDAALAYARDAVAAFEADRRARGRLSFDDLLHGAARLLRTSPAARDRAAQRYRYLLVDEFQDTDPVQAEVLFLLTDQEAHTDWRSSRPRPGALVVVGDPKQSVYRFRRADIETYAEVVDLLDRAGGERLALQACFRTRPALCGWINDALAGPFADDVAAQGTRQRQARYTDLVSARPTAAAPHVSRLDTPKVPRHGAQQIAQAEAEQIAAFVRASVDGHAAPHLYDPGHASSHAQRLGAVFGRTARYGDILVLCRASTRFGAYAAAFEAVGVPYTLGGDKRLGASDEAHALLTLLDAARDPLDGAAQYAHRVGLLGGLTSLDLLVAHGHASAPSDPDGAHARAVAQADALVTFARDTLAALPVGPAFEALVTQTGLLAHAAQRLGGAERAGGLLRLLARARIDQSGGLHWTEAHDRLRDLVDGVATDGRITLDEGAPDAVRILNVHQAKGLEAPVVILADPYSGFSPLPSLHSGRDADGAPFLTAPLVRPGEFHDSIIAAPAVWYARDADADAGDHAEAQRYEGAETRRIAYVAATRARGLLVVSRYPEKAGEGPWGLFDTHLDDAPDLASLYTVGPAPDLSVSPQTPAHEPVADRLVRASRPSATRRAPSAHDGTSPDLARHPDAPSLGATYGTAVHALAEWAVRHCQDPDAPSADRAVATRIWTDTGADLTLLDTGLDALHRFRQSDLWPRLLSAQALLAEAPLAGPGPPDADGTPTYLSGTVDLAYQDADGWHLLDFKTDGLASTEHRDALVDHYAPQLSAYADLWILAVGERPSSLLLFFTDSSHGGLHLLPDTA